MSHTPTYNDHFKAWSTQLTDLAHILDYLHTYPTLLESMGFGALLTSDELPRAYQQWLNVYSKYEGMEKDFFKPSWVPIFRSALSHFVDLSDPKYPVFDFFFHFNEPYAYDRLNLFDSINDLMMLAGSDVDGEEIKEEFKIRLWEFFAKRERGE